ncbi:MAG: SRPBCC family protein, partial [Chloroflexi bacterium]|nr:SRPBCC family protein [Chloroflexota bacterium]
ERLDAGPIRIGSQARINQPKLAPLTWTVTELQPGRAFSWRSSTAGLRSTGDHIVEASDGGAMVTLRMRQEGPLAPLIGLLYGGLTKRYLQMEAAGLKQWCESGQTEHTTAATA